MTTMQNEKNIELTQKFQDSGFDENVFAEIVEVNKKFMKYLLKRYSFIKKMSGHEIESLAYTSLLKSAENFKDGHNIKFTSYYAQNFYKDLCWALDYYKRNGRKEGLSNTFSYHNTKLWAKEGNENEFFDIIEGDKDKYFEHSFENSKDAIKHAINFVKPELQPYVIDMILGEESMTDIGKKFDLSRQVVSYQVKVFKDNFKKYWNENNYETILEA